MPPECCLIYPPDGGVIEGRSVLFEWDLDDNHRHAKHFQLIVKRQALGQSAAEAMASDEIAFGTQVEHVRFFVMPVAQLRARAATYVWHVVAWDEKEGEPSGGASEIRTFGLENGRDEILNVISCTKNTDETAVASVVNAAVPIGEASRPLACPNGDLEMGTLSGWQGRYGSRLYSATINLNNLSIGIINGRHTIRNSGNGIDPELALCGVKLPQVGEGNYSLRLGNSSKNGEADLISYTFTVNAQNKNFTFRYAVVLQNPTDHAPDEQPFFGYYIVRGPSIFFTINPPWAPNYLVTGGFVVADASNPFFKIACGNVYRDWTPTCVDLSAYLGQTMTIVFYTADCSRSAHFGYAYIDGLCLSNEAIAEFKIPKEICGNGTLLADGTASSNETSCFWSIEESDANWGRNPSTEVYQWFIAQQAGPIDLTAFYASKGGHFKCNTYYRIKLAVSNNCTPWNETVQLLHVVCPVVTAGPDVCVSCVPNGQTTQLGAGNLATPGTTYDWSPVTGLDNPASASPLHSQGSVVYPVTYTVTATDVKGCSNSDSVTLYCKKPTVDIGMVVECCNVMLTAITGNYAVIRWSTGEQGVTSIVVTTPGTYSVIVSNPCGSATANVVVPATLGLTGGFNPVAAESIISPPSGSTNPPLSAKMHVKDVIIGNPAGIAGVPHAYNATHYILRIYDRWGNLFKTVQDSSCDGFPNWSIEWDGTDDSGTLVQQDTYVWTLHFKNCQHTKWTLAKERKFARRCVKWATFFGIKLWCKEWEVYIVDEDLPGKVTVVH